MLFVKAMDDGVLVFQAEISSTRLGSGYRILDSNDE